MSTAPAIGSPEWAPGVFRDLPDVEYHGDPCPEGSLSQSGAKVLLDCPARYQWQNAHPVEKSVYDFGHVVHRLILGAGAMPLIVDAPDWRTKAAQEARKQARADRLAPVLRGEFREALAMARKVREHPIASRILTGESEMSAFARDPETRVMMRARFDHLSTLPSGRPVLVDYKTTVTADPARFGRNAYEYGYDIQDSWYRLVAHESGLADDPAFVFILQEKEPPYLVSVVELDDGARDIGAERGRAARHLYVECMTSGIWPGYPERVHSVSLPAYANAPFIPEKENAA